MRLPDEDLPQFPVVLAGEIADELDRLADLVDQSALARVTARSALPEFQCTVADNYRIAVDQHAAQAAGVVEQFRRVAGELRDAAAAHGALLHRIATGLVDVES